MSRFLGWLCALTLMCVSLGANAQQASLREFSAGFGVVAKFSQGEPPSHIEKLPELGVRWVRDGVLWADMEPSPGHFKPFPKDFAERLSRYKEMGIGVVYMLAYANFKAYPKTPEHPLAGIDPKALGRYAAHVAGLFQKAGVKYVLEVWNEPHNFQILKLVGGTWNGAGWSPWVDHYVDMMREVYVQVKAVDPDAVIIDSEDVWVNHYRFFATGKVPKGFSGIGLHPYTNASSSGPEIIAPHADSDWTRPFSLVNRDRSFVSAIARLRDHVRPYIQAEPQIWLTEWGWKIGSRNANGKVDAQVVADFLPRAYILAEAAGAKALCWFSLYDAVDGPWGLIDKAGNERPAFRAYVTMNAQLGAFHLVKRLSPENAQTKGVQAYLFAKGGEQVIAAWNASEGTILQPLSPAWEDLSAVGVTGQKVELKKAGQEVLLPLGASPVYLHVGTTEPIVWPIAEER